MVSSGISIDFWISSILRSIAENAFARKRRVCSANAANVIISGVSRGPT